MNSNKIIHPTIKLPFKPIEFKINKVMGLIIKKAMMVFLYQSGESPRNILYKLFVIFKS